MSCSGGCSTYDPCATPGVDDDACDPDAEKGFGLTRHMERGSTLVLEYGPVVDRFGTPVDFSAFGVKAWFTVKRYLRDIDSKADWQGTLVSGIVQESRGVLVVTVPPIVTANVPDEVDHLYYDLRAMDSAGRVSVLEKGRLAIAPGATRSFA